MASFLKAPPQMLRHALRRYFAERIVYPWELPSIMRKHIYTGAMGSIYFTLISGIFFVYFGNRIGMSPFEWGAMGGIASLLLAVQLLSALITQRAGRRKLLWFWTAMAARIVRIVGTLASLGLWHAGSTHVSLLLIASICLANFFEALAWPPWMSWLADIIPEEQHGGFWGRRSAWIAAAIVCVVVPAGLFIDSVPETWKLHAVVLLFLFAGLLGILDIVIHGTLPEPAMVLPQRNHYLVEMLAPIRDRGFRPWLTFNLSWTFSMTLGGALSTLFFVDDLQLKDNFLGGSVVLIAFWLVGGIMTGGWSGRLVDRLGPKRVLLAGHLGWATLPIFWFLATPRTALVWLGLSSIVGGTAGTAADTAANKLITRFPPPEARAMYVAVSACLASLAGGIGVMLAGIVLRQLEGWTWGAFGATFGPFHALFAASACLRLASALLLIRRIQEPAAPP